MVKLIAIDMDGTLLSEKKHIEEPQKKAIHKAIEAGVKVVLCTGRPLFGILPPYKELELEKYNLDEYVLLNNGCSVHKTTDSQYSQSGAPPPPPGTPASRRGAGVPARCRGYSTGDGPAAGHRPQ